MQRGNSSVSNKLNYGSSVDTQNKYFELFFKDGSELSLGGVDFINYLEMKNYLFDYCIEMGIIHIRPIEERRRSSRR